MVEKFKEVDESEVLRVLKKLKHEKSTERDGITLGLLKKGRDFVMN